VAATGPIMPFLCVRGNVDLCWDVEVLVVFNLYQLTEYPSARCFSRVELEEPNSLFVWPQSRILILREVSDIRIIEPLEICVIASSLPLKSIATFAFGDEPKVAAPKVGRLEISMTGLTRVPGHDYTQDTTTRFEPFAYRNN
jgi:hypothetical protein